MPSHPTPSAARRARVELRPRARLGHARIDDLTLAEALDGVAALVARRQGGTVYAPTVAQIVRLERDARLRQAYMNASLVLADDMPLVWASRLTGTPLRARIAGADLLRSLLQRAAEERWRVHVVGEGDIDPPPHAALVSSLAAARADLVLFARGCPEREIVMDRVACAARPAVCVVVDAALDRPEGEASQPWRRRLIQDPRFAFLLLRQLCWSARSPTRDPSFPTSPR